MLVIKYKNIRKYTKNIFHCSDFIGNAGVSQDCVCNLNTNGL